MGNKFVGKLFRLIGFILIGVTSLYGIVNLLQNSSLTFGLLDDIMNFVNDIPVIGSSTVMVYGFFLGLSLLVWTLSKKIVTKIFFQIFVIVLLALEFSGEPSILHLAAPFDLFALTDYTKYVTDIIYVHLAIYVVLLLMFWWLFNVRRPKRAFASILRFGVFILAIVMVIGFLPELIPSVGFFTDSLFVETILPIVNAIPLLLLTLSSVFAIFQMFNK